MQILVANVAKSIRNLLELQQHVLATMNQQEPFIVGIIEPPTSKENPGINLTLESFFTGGVTEVISSPVIRAKSKIIFLHNRQSTIKKITIVSDIDNHESGRCFGVEFTSSGTNYHLHVIHGLDLINYPESDFERSVCEYNIYKQVKDGAKKNPTIIVGDFNSRITSAALNSTLGLDASSDETKDYSFLNMSSRLVSECHSKFSNSLNVRGSFYFHGNKYGDSKWVALDQLLISKSIKPIEIQQAHYVTMLNPGSDLVSELKKIKTKDNKRLLFDHLPVYMRL